MSAGVVNERFRRAPGAGFVWVAAAAVVLAACSAPMPRGGGPAATGQGGARPDATGGARRGGFYLDDGPGANPPADLEAIPDAVPRPEPLLARANRPYVIFERQYVPMTALAPFRERGPGSWYGRKYHGQKTSSGEVYDMYAMTAAHPTLPIPSYARVTSVRTGRSVVVRVNDRGPFLYGRVIDLSYTAAAKLGYVMSGSAEVEVELITNFDDASVVAARPAASTTAGAVAAVAAVAAAESRPPALGIETVVGGAAVGQAPKGASPPPPQALAMSPSAGAPQPERLTVETTVASPPQPAVAQLPTAASPTAASPTAASPTAALPTAALPTAAPPTVPAHPAAAPGRGHYLQLAAFSSRDNAESSRTRLARDFEWLADRLQVRQEGGMFKVHAGPWSQRDDALSAADRIRQATSFRPFPVLR